MEVLVEGSSMDAGVLAYRTGVAVATFHTSLHNASQ